MNEKAISLERLNDQMQTLISDEKKTKEKLFEIMGAKKVVQFMIDSISAEGLPTTKGNHNG